MGSVYDDIDFWEDWLGQWNGVWCGKSLVDWVSADSFVVSCSIINFYKDQKDVSYMVFPDGESVLGFLEYIFLPTAFIGVLDHDTGREYVLDGFPEFLDELRDAKYATLERIEYMEDFA